jgi:hypothetical protein
MRKPQVVEPTVPAEVKMTAHPAIDIRVHVVCGDADGSLPLSATSPRGTTLAKPRAEAVPH